MNQSKEETMGKGLEKLEKRRKLGLLWKWRRDGASHEVTVASRDAREVRRLADIKETAKYARPGR